MDLKSRKSVFFFFFNSIYISAFKAVQDEKIRGTTEAFYLDTLLQADLNL